MKTKTKIIVGVTLIAGVGYYIYTRKSKPQSVASVGTLDKVSQNIMKRFADSNKQHIDSLNAGAKKEFQDFINDIIKAGYAVVITSSYRDYLKQAAQKDKKKGTPGYSTHNYGIGLDLNLVKDGKWINKDSSNSDWNKTGIVKLAKDKYKMRWGGDFKDYHDPIHFDLGNKYNVVKLYAQGLKQFGTPEKIQGNKLKLAA